MPLMPGLLRRKGLASDAELRRHSSLFTPDPNTIPPVPIIDSRASEQIPRRPSAAEFLSPASAIDGPPVRQSAEPITEDHPRSASPPVQEESQKHRRFSMLKFRHASDSQLSTRARLQAQAQAQHPPLPTPPEIITTAPTMDLNTQKAIKKKSRMKMPGRAKSSSAETTLEQPISMSLRVTNKEKKERRKTMSETAPSGMKGRVTFDEPERPHTQVGQLPPAYGDEASSTLALPINRLSESSRSDGSSGEHGVYATTTTTTHTVSTTTTFFRLPRRKKPAPLFDLSHLPQKSSNQNSTNSRTSVSSSGVPLAEASSVATLRNPSIDNIVLEAGESHPPLPSPSHSYSALAKSSTAFAAPAVPLFRQGSAASNRSSPTRAKLGMRGRSSTLSSLRNAATDDPLPTPPLQSTRTSTSTGRKSFGDLFGLSHRLRQNSEPPFHASGHATPGSSTSKNNSMQLTRDPTPPIVLPERRADDSPAKYLVRLEEAVSRGVVASVLSRASDDFSHAVLRSYMRGFGFFGDPMDMAIRKLLMEVELPKETQHIDRCMQSFADRYHECNPGIFASPDQAYFIAFSLLILHTDVFNKNNKHKMQKPDYLKNTRGEGIFDEILECFYDNISYTPFIHVEDDLDINGERIIQHKMKKKSIFPRGTIDTAKKSRDPVDPYTLIIDSKLDTLRPNLKEVLYVEEHYNYIGTATSLNLQDLQKTFFRTGVLQIVSARSRPDAFLNANTVANPQEAHPGIVDIKITKVGLLWRKDAKKKKTRSPWQEWGAILTGAQLYFFRNTTWIKNLMHQLETHIKQGHDGTPVIFKPPLDQFQPDALMSTDNAVALLDSNYKKHKNAFVFVRHGGFEETFLADNEQEMNDWLAKLNYAAAFRTSGVRMRGVVGGNYEGQRTRGIRRLEGNNESTKSIQTPTGEVTIVSGKIDTKMAQDILAARREIMLQKIDDADERLAVAEKQLDAQLRNARHLQILAPIQAKSREQVLLAAGRMAAQLKWGRLEIWRLRCHRDILTMDLEEERGVDDPSPHVEVAGEIVPSERSPLGRLHSKASTITQKTPRSPSSYSANRPSTSTAQTPQKESGLETGDVFTTPPMLTTSSSFHKQQASWELPPLTFDSASPQKSSLSSATTPATPGLVQTPSRSGLKPMPLDEAQRAPSPSVDAAEQAVLEQSGLVIDTPDSKRQGENEEARDRVNEKEKMDRGKIRRSLHRTLREGHVPTHHRSRKGKDSASSTAMSDESKEDVLSRGTGSFVVHGKKASVITFGSELQSLSPDERMRLRRQPHKDEPGMLSPSTIDDDFHSVLAEPYEFHERHSSAATASTMTARSFRELHKKLHDTSASNAIASDGEDSEAISFSEGRRTPLPPVEDEIEESSSSRPNSEIQQAMFYSASNSPIYESFNEKHGISEHEDRMSEREGLPSSSVSIAAGA